jgi:isoquinoline 1-oxidoreductase beta subunit
MGHFDRLVAEEVARGGIVNVSRRTVMGAAGALVLAFGITPRAARAAQAAVGVPASARVNKVGAFLSIAPDGTITLQNPFIEGGQGINTAIAQIVAEEMDAELASFRVEAAPAGADYLIMFGDHMRITGGSMSVRMSYNTFRKLGATARAMLVNAAAARWSVPAGEITTKPGLCLHPKSDRSASYGALAKDAMGLPVPADVALKDASAFRLIGQPEKRLDTYDKSTGRAQYGIDVRLDGMLYGAVIHSPVNGSEPVAVDNQDAVKAMPGVVLITKLPGAVAVVADSFFRAKKAVAALDVKWGESKQIAADFSSAKMLADLAAQYGAAGKEAEASGDAASAIRGAAKVLEAEYNAPYLAHATMEPQNATARFNADGTLEVWVPNQSPDFYAAAAAQLTGIDPAKVTVHSPLLGGFFGRRVLYGQEPMVQALLLAKAAGKPVKVVWTREEDIARDHYRPFGSVKLQAAIGADGMPVAIAIAAPGEGPTGRHFKAFLKDPDLDESVVEGMTAKPYAIANRMVSYVKVAQPPNIGFWRSVGHSMNDYFYESFLDECAKAGGLDPYAMRLALVKDSARHTALLKAAADLAGGWKPGVYAVGGESRAMGCALASPFGSETATIAEVSVKGGEIAVRRLWIAVDPGAIVNPAIITAQVRGAALMGVSIALLEAITYADGRAEQTNFDSYRFLPPGMAPEIAVAIIESGAPIGGIGEVALPGVPPAIGNAVAVLTGQRVRSLPMSKTRFGV